MYDSGSQWAELTLCLPSPMPFLLDLHDMKLVNFRTAVRYNLRRIDNSDNLQDGKPCDITQAGGNRGFQLPGGHIWPYSVHMPSLEFYLQFYGMFSWLLVPSCPEARSPSPDDFEDEPQQQVSYVINSLIKSNRCLIYHTQNMLSPMSPIFAPIQEHLARLQVDRRNFTHVRELGEGAFGEASTLY